MIKCKFPLNTSPPLPFPHFSQVEGKERGRRREIAKFRACMKQWAIIFLSVIFILSYEQSRPVRIATIKCSSYRLGKKTLRYSVKWESNFSSLGTYADYYVGEMGLLEALDGIKGKRKRRSAIYPYTISHSMILFRGKVFEWGAIFGYHQYYMRRNPSSCLIRWRPRRESYSSCTLSQVEAWTRRYGATKRYNLFTNNCHMFVNNLAKYLYSDCATK